MNQTSTNSPQSDGAMDEQTRPPQRRRRLRKSLFAAGEPMVWMTGGAMLVCMVMITSLLALVLWFGMWTFWPLSISKFTTIDGRVYMGEVTRTESYELNYGQFMSMNQVDQKNASSLLHPQLRQLVNRPKEALVERLAGHELLVRQSVLSEMENAPSLQANEKVDRKALIDKVEAHLKKNAQKYMQRLAGSLEEAAGQDESGQAVFDLWQASGKAKEQWFQTEQISQMFASTQQADEPLYHLFAERSIRELAYTIVVPMRRRLARTGNFRITQQHFAWVSDFEIKDESRLDWALVVERREWGRFYGVPEGFVYVDAIDDKTEKGLTKLPKQVKAEAQKKLASFSPKHSGEKKVLAEVFIDGGNRLVLLEPDKIDQAIKILGVAEVVPGAQTAWDHYQRHHESVRDRWRQRRDLEKYDTGAVNHTENSARLKLRASALEVQDIVDKSGHDLDWQLKFDKVMKAVAGDQLNPQRVAGAWGQLEFSQNNLKLTAKRFGEDSDAFKRSSEALKSAQDVVDQHIKKLQKLQDEAASANDYAQAKAEWTRQWQKFYKVKRRSNKEFDRIRAQIDEINKDNGQCRMLMRTAGEGTMPAQDVVMRLDDMVRSYPANQRSWSEKMGIYLSRWFEYLFDEPREANSEGGVWPAIFGTVLMTLIMSLTVVPFGVLAALYLREYAKPGPMVSAVRIAMTNLAGVPSIVFGVFGLGFFCYIVGGYLDGGPRNIDATPLAPAGWWLILGFTAIMGACTFTSWLFGVRTAKVKSSDRILALSRVLQRVSLLLWLVCLASTVVLLVKVPFFDGFFRSSLPNPTFGKGGLVWASLTLALLTLPVVIVATEEALAAVPGSMREGSYACGASKWQTVKRIVLPRAMPGIMTGTILAMARGAGEVAPLMLVGAVKLAPELNVDRVFPYFHPQRSFMHLGFHIYDVGFQSQNSEAAKPMVYTTTLLLILIVAMLNLAAIWLRKRLRRRFVASQF